MEEIFKISKKQGPSINNISVSVANNNAKNRVVSAISILGEVTSYSNGSGQDERLLSPSSYLNGRTIKIDPFSVGNGGNGFGSGVSVVRKSRVRLGEDDFVQWWHIFFNMSYYIGFSSFKFNYYCVESGEKCERGFAIHRSGIQKVFYIILQISSFLGGVSALKNLSKIDKLSSRIYFDFAAYSGAFMNQLCTIYIFWKSPQIFQGIFNALLSLYSEDSDLDSDENDQRRSRSGINQKKPVSILLRPRRFMTILFTCMFLCEAINVEEDFKDLDWNLVNFLTYVQQMGNNLVEPFYKFPNFSSPDSGLESGNSWGITLQAVFCSYLFVSEHITRTYYLIADTFFIATVLLYGHLVLDFLEKVPNSTPNAVLNNLSRLQKLIKQVNNGVSEFLFTAVMGNLPYYIEKIPELISSDNFNTRHIRRVYFCTYYFGILFYSAKMYKKFEDSLKNWICLPQNYAKSDLVSDRQLQLMLFELNCNHNMGLTMKGMYDLNHGLFTSVVTSILTYSIIAVQFSVSGSSHKSNTTEHSSLSSLSSASF